MNRVIIIGLVALLLLLVSGSALSAPSCASVFSRLAPCLSYLQGRSSAPSSGCCNGVKAVSGQVKNKEDRQAVCECLKRGLANAGSYDPSKIPPLPQKCGVSMDLPAITPSTNCSTA